MTVWLSWIEVDNFMIRHNRANVSQCNPMLLLYILKMDIAMGYNEWYELKNLH